MEEWVVHGMMSLEKLAILSVVLEDPQFNFEARIKCLSWAAVAYFVWQERNERTFKNERHHWEVMVEKIGVNIKEVTWQWRASRSYENWLLCREWGLCDQILLV